MVIQLQPQEVDLLYRLARASYRACISNPENAYLQDEVTRRLGDITVKEGPVKIILSAGSTEVNQIEVHLQLYTDGQWMGNYVSTLTASGEVIDDSLVFH